MLDPNVAAWAKESASNYDKHVRHYRSFHAAQALAELHYGEDVLARRPATLSVPTRVRNFFLNYEIDTVADLLEHTERYLLAQLNFGESSLRATRRALDEHGLKLAGPRLTNAEMRDIMLAKARGSDSQRVPQAVLSVAETNNRMRAFMATIGAMRRDDERVQELISATFERRA